MAAIDFPASPTVGQNFTASNGITYQWTGTFWMTVGSQPIYGQTVSFFAVENGVFGLPSGGAEVTLAFDTVVTGNEGGWYSTSTGRFTPPAGRYHMWATFTGFWSGGATLISTVLKKNGVTVIAAQQVPGNTNWAGDPAIEAILDANGTDYFQIFASANNSAQGIAKHCWFGANSVSLSTPYVANTGGGTFVSGDVKASASPNPQAGWYLCDGSTKNRTTDAALFTAIGTTWGAGDGSTTFNLPDFRGRVLAGVDGGAGRLGSGNAGGITSPATLGAVGGQQSHVQTTTELVQHNHSYTVGGVVANGVNVRGTSGDGTNPGSPFTDVTGGSAASNVVQPTAVVYWFIKA